MTIYRKSKMDSVGDDGSVEHNEPCEVILDGKKITVSFENESWDENGRYTEYKGKDVGEGNYVLVGDDGGRATLKLFPEDEILEGEWEWEDVKADWTITLKK